MARVHPLFDPVPRGHALTAIVLAAAFGASAMMFSARGSVPVDGVAPSASRGSLAAPLIAGAVSAFPVPPTRVIIIGSDYHATALPVHVNGHLADAQEAVLSDALPVDDRTLVIASVDFLHYQPDRVARLA